MDNVIPTDQFDQDVLERVNQERTARGLDPLLLSERLDTAADNYSQTMIDADHFSHTGPDGSSMVDRIEQAGYTNWTRVAENIAAGQRTAQDVVEGWMNSPGHRANILNPDVTHMGLGYAEGDAQFGTRWTQVFGAGTDPGQYVAETNNNSPTPIPTPAVIPTPVPTSDAIPTPDVIPTPAVIPTPVPTSDVIPPPTPTPVPASDVIPTPIQNPAPTPSIIPTPVPTSDVISPPVPTPVPTAPTPVPTAPTPVPTAPTPVPTAPTPVPTTNPMQNPPSSNSTNSLILTDQFDRQVLRLVNQERTNQGLNPLRLSEKLDTAADNYSQTMIDENHFDHTGPDGSSMVDRIEQAGYTNWNRLAENIAAGQRTPNEVVEGWMNSPGHRANILNPDLTHMGLGYAEGDAQYGTRWTQVFGAGANPGQYVPQSANDLSVAELNAASTSIKESNEEITAGEPLDLSGIESYGGSRHDRNSRMRINRNNTALKVRGNGWKRLGIDYDITPDTMIKVEFRSNAEGEIQGIGFDTDNTIRRSVDKDRLFQFSGTQEWGNLDFNDYVTGEGWKTYEIPVGEYFTGEVDYLTFANDHDVRQPTAISQFRNIELFERSGLSDQSEFSNNPLEGEMNPLNPSNGVPFTVDTQEI